jgi:hypothetical protein
VHYHYHYYYPEQARGHSARFNDKLTKSQARQTQDGSFEYTPKTVKLPPEDPERGNEQMASRMRKSDGWKGKRLSCVNTSASSTNLKVQLVEEE